jgi:hypothetical protein
LALRDDGYLSASEIAALKLDADWGILSVCNTAAGAATSAEALPGLARAQCWRSSTRGGLRKRIRPIGQWWLVKGRVKTRSLEWTILLPLLDFRIFVIHFFVMPKQDQGGSCSVALEVNDYGVYVTGAAN